MNEFDKIKELSDDIMGRKEPSFKEVPETAEENTEKALPDASFLTEDPVADDNMTEDDVPTVHWWLILLAAFIGISAVVLIGFFLFGREEQSDSIITISATPEPVRVKPEEAGGISIPDQDKLVYTRTQGATPKVEKLFPEPEKPVLPELMKRIEPVLAEIEEEEWTNNEPEIVIEQAEPEPKKEVLALPAQKVETKPQTTTKPTVTAPAKKATGSWRIQLYSTPKKAMAEKTWTEISQKQKALLSDMPHYVVTAEIAGKGTFYRLQAGQFSSREQATALCTKLKAKKQDCIPVQAGK